MPKMQVDKDLIRELADLLDETSLTEIEVEEGERRIRVARNAGGAVALPGAGAPAGTEESVQADSAPVDHPGSVFSPMVGTVYFAPEPEAPPFVSEGSQVEQGQTLLIVEAMKVMNPIAAPRAGRIRSIAVVDSQPVEYGQLLMIIE